MMGARGRHRDGAGPGAAGRAPTPALRSASPRPRR